MPDHAPDQPAPVTAVFDAALPAALDAGRRSRARWVYAFELLGGEGSWTLDLAAATPSCRPGARAGHDCHLAIAAAELAAVLEGRADLEQLFFEQRLVVKGNMEAAAALPGVLDELLGPERAFGLAPLVAPLPVDEFLRDRWPDRLWIGGAPDASPEFAAIPQLRDVHALLEVWPGVVRVFGPHDDHALSPQVDVETGAKLYERGFTLVFSCVDLLIPALKTQLEALRSELGLAPNTWARCMVYANPTGGALNPHFDENANFVVQLHGRKIWRLAPNTHVRHPTTSHLIGGPVDPELEPELDAPLPDRLPDTAETVTLTAGSRMFLPRGYWHETRASEPSMSLNFTFSQPCWADVLAEGLRRRLLEEPAWRELAEVGEPARLAELTRAEVERLAAVEPAELAGSLVASLVPRIPDEVDVLDLRRDWVAALARLGARASSSGDSGAD
ncbi:Cupin superfamily protein [Enhygromyxa salina]|uniref:Cupin superfamily protein n=1 Tax=Enhygromyxa salina TaxID=215803 RepID=A0A2S9XX19_9BACT|nr:cupin domain-containing protein [Enhygromyxa salina]PRP97393.1 Cupin superfamily protein [Enhygromyxa salina]